MWTPTDTTTVHAGFARYFSPPPFELVATTDVALFDNTTAAGGHTDSTPKAERADYYDMGVVQKLFEDAEVGLDSFFKASHNLIDEGQFGAPIILTPFNYQTGRQYGMELTTSYQSGPFSAYANAAYERADGRNIVSSEFQFDPGDLAYIATHFIPLDHQQIGSVSGGASYDWDGTLLSTDLLYGTGLRRNGATPNGDHVPPYVTVNFGISHGFDFGGFEGITARVDVLNAFDEQYEIRDGTGIGVGAPQFGARRGFFFGLSKSSEGGRIRSARARPAPGETMAIKRLNVAITRRIGRRRSRVRVGPRGVPVFAVLALEPSPLWRYRWISGAKTIGGPSVESGCGGSGPAMMPATPTNSEQNQRPQIRPEISGRPLSLSRMPRTMRRKWVAGSISPIQRAQCRHAHERKGEA